MADSYKATAFQRCFDALKTGLQIDLNGITPRLYAKGLISDSSQMRVLSGAHPCDERAAHLVTVLLQKITIQPSSFDQILVELDACPVLEVLAETLREKLKQVEREASMKLLTSGDLGAAKRSQAKVRGT